MHPIGIDLGTTNSVVAALTAGQPEIIENADGKRFTPSTVAIHPKTGERLVGDLARRQAITNPDNTVFSAKRFIGRRFLDESVQRDLDLVPFKIAPMSNGDVGIEFDGALRSPEEISAIVLRKLRDFAAAKLGETPSDAVVTVPAYFTNAQRDATRTAGRIAGFKTTHIISEPTAAALAYGLGKTGKQTIAVYDLGGGTFDISIVRVGDGDFEALSTNGDTHLGGDDFDLRIMDWLADEFQQRELIDLRKHSDRSPLQRLRQEAERVKIELSSHGTSEVNLPFLTADETGPKHLATTMHRAQLEHLVEDLIERTVNPCEEALDAAELTVDDIDEVILVGGTTRVPAVQQRVRDIFGKEPNQTVNPDEVVALGAAIQAGALQGHIDGIRLRDVIPLDLGISASGGVMTVLIPRNTRFPTTNSSTFFSPVDNATEMPVDVYQGQRKMTADNILIGEFILDRIPPAPRGAARVEVRFDVDADGILTVTATDLATGRDQHITVSGQSGLSDDEIARIVAEAEAHEEADRERVAIADLKNGAFALIYDAEKRLNDPTSDLDDASRNQLQQLVTDLQSRMADPVDIRALRFAIGELRLWRPRAQANDAGEQASGNGAIDRFPPVR